MEKHINHHKGDSFSFVIQVDEDAMLEGCAFLIWKTYGEHSSENMLLGITDDGITRIDAQTRRVRIAPAKTRNLTPGAYPYTCTAVVNGEVYTILEGTFVLLP
jgi:hypothetical protein